MKLMARAMALDLLIESNEVIITAEASDGIHTAPYRGKCNRSAILSFLEFAGKKARAIVYSHDAKTGPVGIDVASGEALAWTPTNE
ncbi:MULTISPECIES: hypothetical protein [Paraburkholderia]|uniref:Uncharacterized protein n=1 Tax=Paraburkholderia madseniana TaxID=2599607 RepID=A0AAP5BMY3_9BURK|nr:MULTISPECIES: hypothetical protein [Paraburkholderia]MCX4151000.1 hypothetical protein [Paraburkholderia madseniana]MCX4176640.1 hypothetical protein [Paraburkholderia madseniana]MDN7153932.1 hypothetical protein [Paraburkholderia sp. WS6]MDQ6412814.1 hypothetical protein [Paraburkholderia madseniana]MDQ6464631.1 hypothetical protein [Paraburkholderia madseniana]